MDRGPWGLFYGDEKPARRVVGLISGDFDHDVVLRVDGDFGTEEHKEAYCRWLASVLNGGGPTERGNVVAVSGGRDYGDWVKVYNTLDQRHALRPIDLLMQGKCVKGGADRHAENWAAAREINCLSVPAKWKKHRTGAGFVRNAEMGAMRPNEWVFFHGGNGTAHAKQIADEQGITKVEVEP